MWRGIPIYGIDVRNSLYGQSDILTLNIVVLFKFIFPIYIKESFK